MKLKRVKRRRARIFSTAGVLLLRLLSKRISLAANQAIGAALGVAIIAFMPHRRRVARANLAVCFPDMTAAERRRTMRHSFRECGKLLFEVGYLWNCGASRIRALAVEVEGEEIRRRAETRGSVIYATPHLGCWEIAGLYVALDRPLYCLYKRAHLESAERFIRDGREAGGLKLCPSDKHGVKQLLRALAAGENVGILPDQAARTGHGVHAPFFGYSAYTMTLLSKLARRAPVVFTIAERLPHGRGYRICFSEPPPDIYDADPVVSATAVNTAVERLVRRCPQQYFWVHRRFARSSTEIHYRKAGIESARGAAVSTTLLAPKSRRENNQQSEDLKAPEQHGDTQ